MPHAPDHDVCPKSHLIRQVCLSTAVLTAHSIPEYLILTVIKRSCSPFIPSFFLCESYDPVKVSCVFNSRV